MGESAIEAVILSQGNELTWGQTLDSNSSWLAGRLWALGVPVRRVLTVPDRLDELADALRQAASLAPVVISTGGLGPTRDDLTAEAAALAFGRSLAEDPEALAQVVGRFAAWGREMSPANRKQAVIPEGSAVIENPNGTAPGFALDTGSCLLSFLPGVPHEMKAMFEASVLPRIRDRFRLSPPIYREIGVILPESQIEDRLLDVQRPDLEVGFRADLKGNRLKLRFSPEFPQDELPGLLAEIERRMADASFGTGVGDLAEVVGAALAARGETLAIAESCTGGQLCGRIAAFPGASRFLLEGVVAYADAAKLRRLGVREETLAEHGAVSEAVAREMAAGVRDAAGSTWGVGVSGIAGPDGGSAEKPVGTVHIAVAGPGGAVHQHHRLPGDRARVIARATTSALFLLYQQLTAQPPSDTADPS